MCCSIEPLLGLLGLENEEQAIGQILNVSGKNTKPTIVGILEDFQTYDIGTDIDPVILFCEPARINWANVRVLPGHMPEAVAHLEQVWAELGSPWKVEYDLFTMQIQKGMRARIYSDVLHIIALISAIGVLLALLGVLGIAMHVMEMQVKAVAIRKVLGSEFLADRCALVKGFSLDACCGGSTCSSCCVVCKPPLVKPVPPPNHNESVAVRWWCCRDGSSCSHSSWVADASCSEFRPSKGTQTFIEADE